MADSTPDIVASYTVHNSGPDEKSYAAVKALLDGGYRVVDVLQTPANVSGSAIAPVVVTVVLTLPSYAGGQSYKSANK